MIQRMLAGALFAGCAAGLLAALLHFAFVQNALLLAEDYESGALVHFQGAQGGDGHSHDHTAPAEPSAEAVDEVAEEEASPLRRNALTVMFFMLTYTGYATILVAGLALAAQMGIAVGAAEGVLWGIAGFVTFQFAPAMGLAPELPGTVAADLGERQVWWWSTVVCTGAGLALLAYGRTLLTALAAGALLAAPHVIGAPELEQFFGTAPPELAATFAARVLGAALVTWAFMGWVAAKLWNGKAAA
ncbi:CbtA family protein [Frigidibacter sp. RF13]|uniref:CbtA family protein n=1 Tax=Frigidibacter sp. RF13 TaxID=2997340 RepID=UPI00226F7FE2|nr:CbtA family protein [Frigidibacter sp. RF13]MCY1128351.1 CbtA family protein [Frigidibacter sp. RF13]